MSTYGCQFAVHVSIDAVKLRRALNKEIDGKVTAIRKDPEKYILVGTEFLQLITDYIPYGKRENKRYKPRLNGSARVDTNGLHWIAPYAEYQYNGPKSWNRYKGIHTKARSRWAGPQVQGYVRRRLVKEITPYFIDKAQKA